MQNIRVRFAPSPTGPLHIGGVRTALYNYLFAKKNKGVFILRIEDTDQKRYIQGAEDYIIEALDWMGLSPDEGPKVGGDFGPYRQSERSNIYLEYVEKLIRQGHAYHAFDTPEELDKMREGNPQMRYDHSIRNQMRNSLSLPESKIEQLLEQKTPFTVRLKVEPNETVVVDDRIRGTVTFSTNELDDKVLLKADGLPTYHMANIVDDHLMEISHVIRGEEWLSSSAHHVLLYQALGWKAPEFVHLPLILKPQGKGKLSKRDGSKFGIPVFPLEWNKEEEKVHGFREFGLLPEASINFLALLGWNPGTDQEIFSLEELADAFNLDQVSKSGARFDFEKAKWFNHEYIQKLNTEKLINLVDQELLKKGVKKDQESIRKYTLMMKDRAHLLSDFYALGRFLFENIEIVDSKNVRKRWKDEVPDIFVNIIAILANQEEFSANTLEVIIKDYISKSDSGMGKLLPLLRIALVGKMAGPDLFEMMVFLGKEETLSRLETASKQFQHIGKDG